MQNQALNTLLKEKRANRRFYLFHGMVIVASLGYAVSELTRGITVA